MAINMNTALDRYNFIIHRSSSHLRYMKLTAISLPISKLVAIITTDMKLPANNKPIPLTEKYAALPAISKATVNNNTGNNLMYIFIHLHKYIHERCHIKYNTTSVYEDVRKC